MCFPGICLSILYRFSRFDSSSLEKIVSIAFFGNHRIGLHAVKFGTNVLVSKFSRKIVSKQWNMEDRGRFILNSSFLLINCLIILMKVRDLKPQFFVERNLLPFIFSRNKFCGCLIQNIQTENPNCDSMFFTKTLL